MKPLLWDQLYFDNDHGEMMTIDSLIDNLTPLMKDLKDFTDRSIFSTLMSSVLDVFSECYVDYLQTYLVSVIHHDF